MKLLVTGGLGFMGSNFIRYMLERHSDVVITNLDKMTYAGNPENLQDVASNPRYHFVKGDIADEQTVKGVVETFRPDAIVNYAAETHVDRSIEHPGAFVMTDVIGAYHLLEATRNQKVTRYVQISTDEVFGSVEEGESTETSPFNPSSPYSASKAGADHLVHAYYRTYETPTIVTHSVNNYGPFQYPEKLIPLFVTNLLEGEKVPVYGSGSNIREWLYVLDHARAIDCVLREGEEGGIYNIGTGERLTNLMITQKLLDLLGKDETAIDYVLDRAGHDYRYAVDATKLRALGWKPAMTFDQGIEATVRWYQGHVEWWRKIKSGEFRAYYQKQYVDRK